MTTPFKPLLAGAALVVLAGCAESVTRWNSEVGSQLDDGWFGNATMHNMLAQMCRGPGGTGYKGSKTGTVTDPLVVLDPAATPSRPIYRVHCDGQLNGKYAQVIFREYIASAVPPPTFGIEVEASAE